ncbi:MAG: DUF4234 domain-containing protein [Erysipelotrichaceae bacterium]
MKQRNFWITILLSFFTFGIYSIYVEWAMVKELNFAARQYNVKPITGFWMALLLSFITCGIYQFFWLYSWGNLHNDLGYVTQANLSDSGTTYVILLLLSPLTCGITGFIMGYRLFENQNRLVLSTSRTF